jgi:hypothetical protein
MRLAAAGVRPTTADACASSSADRAVTSTGNDDDDRRDSASASRLPVTSSESGSHRTEQSPSGVVSSRAKSDLMLHDAGDCGTACDRRFRSSCAMDASSSGRTNDNLLIRRRTVDESTSSTAADSRASGDPTASISASACRPSSAALLAKTNGSSETSPSATHRVAATAASPRRSTGLGVLRANTTAGSYLRVPGSGESGSSCSPDDDQVDGSLSLSPDNTSPASVSTSADAGLASSDRMQNCRPLTAGGTPTAAPTPRSPSPLPFARTRRAPRVVYSNSEDRLMMGELNGESRTIVPSLPYSPYGSPKHAGVILRTSPLSTYGNGLSVAGGGGGGGGGVSGGGGMANQPTAGRRVPTRETRRLSVTESDEGWTQLNQYKLKDEIGKVNI